MHNSDGMLPDDVPVVDAVDQQRPTSESPSDDEDYESSKEPESDVPLEVTPADWQEQQEPVLIDPDFEEPGQ